MTDAPEAKRMSADELAKLSLAWLESERAYPELGADFPVGAQARAKRRDARQMLADAAPRLLAEIAALSAFKTYVHKRLDDAGIPTHPDGPHSKNGCRIGDRLDTLIARVRGGGAERERCAKIAEALSDLIEVAGGTLAMLEAKRKRGDFDHWESFEMSTAMQNASAAIRRGEKE